MSRSAQSPETAGTFQRTADEVVEENRRLRRTMRDLVALSTLPAIWSGLDRAGIARSLCDVLITTLSLDLIYLRLTGPTRTDLVEVARSSHPPHIANDEAVKALIDPLLMADGGDPPATVEDPFGAGTLHVAVIRFGMDDDQGALVACSRNTDFPTEQDRLLLGVGANQTAIVVQRRQAEQQVQDQNEWLRVTLESIGDAVIATDIHGRVTYLNPIAEKLTAWTADEAQGQPLQHVYSILDEDTRTPVENPVDQVLRHGSLVAMANRSMMLVARDGTERPIDDSAAPIMDSSNATMGVVMVFRDVTEQRRAEQQHSARLAVTHALNQAVTIEDGASGVLRAVCENLAWDVGIFWVANDELDRLVYRASWHRPGAPVASFATDSANHTFECGKGLPGHVWASRESLWMPDVRLDQNFPRLASAVRSGLRSAFASPIVIGDQTLGVIEFFARHIHEPDADFSEMMGTVAVNFGQFIERKTAENELRRSEQELAEFFENATIGLHWVGEDGRILKANRAEMEMLGYGPEEYIGGHIADFHADQDDIRDILGKLKTGEKLIDRPARLRCKDGSVKDVLIDSSVRWHEGRFVHTQCFTRDITESKRAGRALTDARARLDAALEAGAIATWTWDIPSNRLFANTDFARLFNLPPSEGEGGLLENYGRSIHPDDLPGVTAALQHSLESGEDYHADYRIMQADGSVRWVTSRGRAERDAAGRPVRMPGVLVDITDRKALEEELRVRVDQLAEADRRKDDLLASLRESEEKLQLLADTIPQLAWMARPDGDIFWYNRGWYEYTGTTLDQMEGWGWTSVHDPDVLPQVLERWKGSIASGEPFEMVFPIRSADGEFRSFLTRVNPLRNDEGRILYWCGTNTDISEIKRMEDALREADRRKDEFLATLAHELRNPLAPIRNSLEILKMPRVDEATVRQTKAMIERQVHHLVRLVDDLLDVSRVMRGKIVLRRQPVELANVVARAVETVQSRIEDQGHRLDLSISPESMRLNADPIRLAQVIGNLLTNAAKYTEANGSIWLTAEREGGQAVLKVRDNGIGIAPDMLPHVFELFVQADHAATRSQGGLGIGLTLVKNLMEMHDGTVAARSAGPGQGAEFEIRLPLMTTEPHEPEVPADVEPQPTASSDHRLLVVDDNEDAAVSLAMLLRLRGHEVRIAHDGPSALAMAKTYLPNLVFLDIGMPGMDGYEVARQMRQHPGLESVVLAALTGWGQQEDRLRTAEAGFDCHLVKPPEPKALESLLDELKP